MRLDPLSLNETVAGRCDECETRTYCRQFWSCETCEMRIKRIVGHGDISCTLCPRCSLNHRGHWMKIVDFQEILDFQSSFLLESCQFQGGSTVYSMENYMESTVYVKDNTIYLRMENENPLYVLNKAYCG